MYLACDAREFGYYDLYELNALDVIARNTDTWRRTLRSGTLMSTTNERELDTTFVFKRNVSERNCSNKPTSQKTKDTFSKIAPVMEHLQVNVFLINYNIYDYDFWHSDEWELIDLRGLEHYFLTTITSNRVLSTKVVSSFGGFNCHVGMITATNKTADDKTLKIMRDLSTGEKACT